MPVPRNRQVEIVLDSLDHTLIRNGAPEHAAPKTGS